MTLSAVGYLLIFLFGLAVCLFCWLTYASLSCAAKPPARAAQPQPRLFGHSAHDLNGPIGAGSA